MSTAAALISVCLALLGLAVVIAVTFVGPRHQPPPRRRRLAAGPSRRSSAQGRQPTAPGVGEASAAGQPPSRRERGAADDPTAELHTNSRGISSRELAT